VDVLDRENTSGGGEVVFRKKGKLARVGDVVSLWWRIGGSGSVATVLGIRETGSDGADPSRKRGASPAAK